MIKTQYILMVMAFVACSEQSFSNKGANTSQDKKTQTQPPADNTTQTDEPSTNTNDDAIAEAPAPAVDEASKVYKYICKTTKTLKLSTLAAVELANLPADAKRVEFEFSSYSSVGVQNSDLALVFNQQQTGITFLKISPTGGNKGDIVAPIAKPGSNVAILSDLQPNGIEKNINVNFIAAYQTDSPCPTGFTTEAIQ